tara:strand:- start:373 stop:1059 length:687 start_codon:yes stop_codon:yes gene_type:complete
MLLKYYQKLDDAISYLFSSINDEKKLLNSYFKKNKIIYVDIGTNEGSYLDFLTHFVKFKKVVCFEPIKNLSDNLGKKYKNLNIHNYNLALTNSSGHRIFYQYDISSQSSLYVQNDLYKSLKKLKKKFKVKTNKFDKIFNTNSTINFCKIDVQGEEVNVLKGMAKNLKHKNIKLIKIELSFTERYKNVKPNFYDILTYLNKFNYKLVSISKIKYNNQKLLLMDAFFSIK